MTATPRVLVVDDERAVRTVLRVHLEKRRCDVTCVEDAHAALDALHDRPYDVVFTDVRMPGASGLELLERVRRSWPTVQVVVMTGHGSVEDAVRAMKAGAADYLVKPIGRDELSIVLDRALENRTLRAELVQLRRDVQERYGFEALIGATPVMIDVYEQIAAVADSSATVLLQGPTGTGKELLAHALHYRSRRATGPFVRVNCTALPEQLLASELFGHEKGSFTGAIRQHRGKFEQADGGTLFLDEIGDVDAGMQAKLLRVLESGELQRVGGTRTLTVDVRVVAATHRDLAARVRDGRFREDLFYRLNVVTVRVPPLAERLDDVPLLVEHFVRRVAEREGRPIPNVSAATLHDLRSRAWPGNVRQLEHVVERAVLLHQGDGELTFRAPDEAGPVVGPPPEAPPTAGPPVALPEGTGLHEALEAYEREILLHTLGACDGVQAEAARRLDISTSNMSYRLKKLGIRREPGRFVAPSTTGRSTEGDA